LNFDQTFTRNPLETPIERYFYLPSNLLSGENQLYCRAIYKNLGLYHQDFSDTFIANPPGGPNGKNIELTPVMEEVDGNESISIGIQDIPDTDRLSTFTWVCIIITIVVLLGIILIILDRKYGLWSQNN